MKINKLFTKNDDEIELDQFTVFCNGHNQISRR